MSPDELVELFAPFGPVQARRMFGGVGIFAEGLMFALQARGDLYLKVDAAFSERLAGLGSTPFGYTTSTRHVTLPYWRLPDEALDDEDLRRDLFRAAFQVARAAAAGKKSAGKRKAAGKTRAAAEPGKGVKVAPEAGPVLSVPPDLDALGLGRGTNDPPKAGRRGNTPKARATKAAKPRQG